MLPHTHGADVLIEAMIIYNAGREPGEWRGMVRRPRSAGMAVRPGSVGVSRRRVSVGVARRRVGHGAAGWWAGLGRVVQRWVGWWCVAASVGIIASIGHPLVTAEVVPSGSGVAITLAAEAEPSTPVARGGHRLPVRAAVIRGFDNPELPYMAGHRGVDLAVPPGAPVVASMQGVVAFAGMVGGRPVVSIDHPGGIRTTYDPVVPSVSRGQKVERGEVIGVVSVENEYTHGPGLGWGAKIGDSYLDPLSLLGAGGVRLKTP